MAHLWVHPDNESGEVARLFKVVYPKSRIIYSANQRPCLIIDDEQYWGDENILPILRKLAEPNPA